MRSMIYLSIVVVIFIGIGGITFIYEIDCSFLWIFFHFLRFIVVFCDWFLQIWRIFSLLHEERVRLDGFAVGCADYHPNRASIVEVSIIFVSINWFQWIIDLIWLKNWLNLLGYLVQAFTVLCNPYELQLPDMGGRSCNSSCLWPVLVDFRVFDVALAVWINRRIFMVG